MAGKKFIVTRTELARLLGVTADNVSRFISDGMPALNKGGGRGNVTTLDLGQVLPWLLSRTANLREESLRWQARKIELEVRQREGELVEAAEIEARWASVAVSIREHLLSLPGTAAQRGLISDEDGLAALVDETLSELSNGKGATKKKAAKKKARKR